jgi:ferritin-like metal-binding protein YciE
MRRLAESEIISLTSMLKMEKDGLAVARGMQTLISDDELKKTAEASILATEGRVKGIQQFINENKITNVEGVQ